MYVGVVCCPPSNTGATLHLSACVYADSSAGGSHSRRKAITAVFFFFLSTFLLPPSVFLIAIRWRNRTRWRRSSIFHSIPCTCFSSKPALMFLVTPDFGLLVHQPAGTTVFHVYTCGSKTATSHHAAKLTALCSRFSWTTRPYQGSDYRRGVTCGFTSDQHPFLFSCDRPSFNYMLHSSRVSTAKGSSATQNEKRRYESFSNTPLVFCRFLLLFWSREGDKKKYACHFRSFLR